MTAELTYDEAWQALMDFGFDNQVRAHSWITFTPSNGENGKGQEKT